MSMQVETGSLKSTPRDSLIEWRPEQQWGRLHLIVNNMRFVMLDERRRHPNLALHVLSLICARFSDD